MNACLIHRFFAVLLLPLLLLASCDSGDVANENNEASELVFDPTQIVADCNECINSADTTILAFCDAEVVAADSTGTFYHGMTKDQHLGNPLTRSDEEAFSGKFSCKVGEGRVYGITYKTTALKRDQYIRITAYKKGKGGSIVVSSPTDRVFHRSGFDVIGVKDDWLKVELKVTLPPHLEGNEVAFYVANQGKEPVYFDDFKVEVISEELFPYNNYPTINLKIGEKGMQQIAEKREEAFRRGILFGKKEDWVDAIYEIDGVEHDAKVRLKGDWLDHLHGIKWSYRVKPKDGVSFQSVSIHTPLARHWMDEWAFHKLLKQEGVLTTDYDFKQLVIDGKSYGIYAVEQHYDRSLVASKGLPDGPLIKFSEDGFWNVVEFMLDRDGNAKGRIPDLQASVITPFEKGRMDEPEFRKQFEEAQQLLHAMRYGTRPVSECVDVESLAKLYALSEVSMAWHSLRWHNLRFYYHPTEKKLYPVAFDAYSELGPYKWVHKPFLGYTDENVKNVYFMEEQLLYHPFNDTVFAEAYFRHLNKYSDQNFVEQFGAALLKEMEQKLNFLRLEWPNYNYSYEYLIKGNNAMEEHRSTFAEVYKSKHWPSFTYVPWKNVGDTIISPQPIKKQDVLAYTDSIGDGWKTIKVHNFRADMMSLAGYKQKKDEQIHYFGDTIYWIGPYDNAVSPPYETVNVPAKAKYIMYQVPGSNELYRAKVIGWASPY